MIEINNLKFSIYIVKPYSKRLKRSDGTYTLGSTDFNERAIYVREGLFGALLDKVITHELVHCFCLAYSVYMDIDTEELCADFIATYGREIFDIADEVIGRYLGYGRDRRVII